MNNSIDRISYVLENIMYNIIVIIMTLVFASYIPNKKRIDFNFENKTIYCESIDRKFDFSDVLKIEYISFSECKYKNILDDNTSLVTGRQRFLSYFTVIVLKNNKDAIFLYKGGIFKSKRISDGLNLLFENFESNINSSK